MRKGDEVQYQNAEWAEADRKIVGRALRIAAKDIKQRRDGRLKPKGPTSRLCLRVELQQAPCAVACSDFGQNVYN
jgi:hypothetical protein